MERIVALLFIVLVLFGCSVAADYILFAFGKTPVFATTLVQGSYTEHVGMIYVVTEKDGALSWEWIWNKLLVKTAPAE